MLNLKNGTLSINLQNLINKKEIIKKIIEIEIEIIIILEIEEKIIILEIEKEENIIIEIEIEKMIEEMIDIEEEVEVLKIDIEEIIEGLVVEVEVETEIDHVDLLDILDLDPDHLEGMIEREGIVEVEAEVHMMLRNILKEVEHPHHQEPLLLLLQQPLLLLLPVHLNNQSKLKVIQYII